MSPDKNEANKAFNRIRRREMVARLYSQGHTIRDIPHLLYALYVEDQTEVWLVRENGKPWAKSTISDDLTALRADWREMAGQEVNDHIDRQLAEIQRLKRVAEAAGKIGIMRQLIETEMKLLGTGQVNVNVGTDWREVFRRIGLDPDSMLREALKQSND